VTGPLDEDALDQVAGSDFAENPQRLRTVDRADVFKGGELAATLTRTQDGVTFRYVPQWVDGGAPPVATTLQVSDAPVLRAGGALPAYFSGLLPEGRRLSALRRAVKTSADDELSLLLAVGADTVGDVQIVPEGVRPEEVRSRVTIEHTPQLRFADLLMELGIKVQREALPGVQDKASAAMLNLPISRAGERYILKLSPPEYPYLVENEAFFLRAAKASGLTVPHAELVLDRDGQAGLLVRRFDRVTENGAARALAVEDACQVLARPPGDKYIVGTEATFAGLATVCDAPVLAARELVRQLAFAYLTGNGDAHAKNFSVVQTAEGEWRVSPVYDVPSSQPYGDTTMALSLGGRISGDFGGSEFVALGCRIGVPERAVRGAIADLIDRADLWLADLDGLPFDVGQVRKLRRVIDYRRRRLGQ
jgi:serine/threonine-protein kinase HipA